MNFKLMRQSMIGALLLFMAPLLGATQFQYSIEPLTGSMGSGVLPHGEEFILRSKLEHIHVWPISEMRSSLRIIPEIDQLYTSTDNQRAVLAKFGLKPTKAHFIQKIMPMGEYFLYHTQIVKGGTPVAMAFVGFTEKEVRSAVKRIEDHFWVELQERIFRKWQRYAVSQAWIEPACAQTIPVCSVDDNLAQIGKLTAQTFASTVGQHMLRCLAQAGSGVVQSAKSLWASVKQAATDPLKFWKNTTDEFIEIKKFLTGVGAQINNFWKSLNQLDPSILPDLVCTLAGQVVVDFITGLAVPGGLAKVAAKIGQLLVKLNNGSKALLLLSKLKAAGQLKDASGPIKAILQNQMPDEMTNILQKFSKTNPAVVKRVLQCF